MSQCIFLGAIAVRWRPLIFGCWLLAIFCTLGMTGRNEPLMKTIPRAAFLAVVLLGPLWYGLDLASAPASAPQTKPSVYVSDFVIDVVPPESGIQKPEDDPG